MAKIGLSVIGSMNFKLDHPSLKNEAGETRPGWSYSHTMPRDISPLGPVRAEIQLLEVQEDISGRPLNEFKSKTSQLFISTIESFNKTPPDKTIIEYAKAFCGCKNIVEIERKAVMAKALAVSPMFEKKLSEDIDKHCDDLST